jgi:hypothetical protein
MMFEDGTAGVMGKASSTGEGAKIYARSLMPLSKRARCDRIGHL